MTYYGELEKRRREGAGPSRPEVEKPRKHFEPLPEPDPDDEPLPVDERLSMRGHGFRAQVRSKSTQDAYKRDFEHFAAWCKANTRASMPASPETVEFYLNDNWEKFALNTLSRRLVGIAHAHKKAEHPSPTTSELVRETFKGIRRAAARQGRSRPKQALPLLFEDVQELVAELDLTTLIGLRDRVVLLIGFAGAFRASEPGSIHFTDLKKHRRGYLISLRQSKTDQEGTGDAIPIPILEDKTICPVHALDEWLKASGITKGPILRQVNRHGQIGEAGLSRHGINWIVKRCVTNAGWDTEGYSGHSLRAGLPTTAHLEGASAEDIKRQGRWKSNVFRDYIRIANLFQNNAATTAMTKMAKQ